VVTNAKIEGRGLAPFTTLTSLSLENNPVDDAGVETLVRNKQLTDLNLSGTRITDNAFSVIAKNLPDLQKLNVRKTQLTDAGLEALKPLKHLREVRAAGTQITKAGKNSLKSVIDFGNDFVDDVEVGFFSFEVE
jgi:Leucine-rich repeat (LRR) protein